MKIFGITLLLLLAGCATSKVPTEQTDETKQATGERDKFVVANIAGLATGKGKPEWGPKTGETGEYQSYMTYTTSDGTVRPVLGQDGLPLKIIAKGHSVLVVNHGTLTQTATGSGTSSGTQTTDTEKGSEPTSNPTNETDVEAPITR